MRVIKNVDGRTAALARLTAAMINFELGEEQFTSAAAHGAGGRALTPPFAPAITVKTEPHPDAHSFAREYTYRPAVGFLYFVPGEGFELETLAAELCRLLPGYGYKHLCASSRVVEATPSATLRHSRTALAATTHPHTVMGVQGPAPARYDADVTRPARLIVRSSVSKIWPLPPATSFGAAFTWYLLPFGAAFEVKTIETFAHFNALAAALLYDDAGFCRLDDAAVTFATPGWDVFLSPALPFDRSGFAAALAGRTVVLAPGLTKTPKAAGGPAPQASVDLLLDDPLTCDERLIRLGGTARCIPPALLHGPAAPVEKGPASDPTPRVVEVRPQFTEMGNLDDPRYPFVSRERLVFEKECCVLCSLPLWGPMFAFHAIRVEPSSRWMSAFTGHEGQAGYDGVKDQLLLGAPEQALGVCLTCFASIADPQELVRDGVSICRTTAAAGDQAEALRADSLGQLAWLVEHDGCREIADIPGAYCLSKKGKDSVVVVCSHCLRGARAFAYSAIVALGARLPVLPVARIAVVRMGVIAMVTS
jgi:hypothetical protein